METVWVSKGEDTRLIERKQLSMYKEQGFEKCPEPDQTPAVEEPEKPNPGLVTLYKDGQECYCDKTQLEAMEAAGWSVDQTATKGAPDGSRRQQLEGRKLDQEHGSGEHGDEPGDEEVGVEQPKGNRRNRPYRRKRGNDEDS